MEDHRSKIKKISKYSDFELDRIISLITGKIRFINIKLISKRSFEYAESLTKDVDIDDSEFVALTEHIKGKLWSGDKQLIEGLREKGWKKVISIEDLFKTIFEIYRQ
nr:hypothetical protein [Cytophagales bacterium]